MITVKQAAKVVAVVASIGAGMIVASIIREATPEDARAIRKAFMWVGGVVIGMMVCDQVSTYAETTINKTFGPEVKVEALPVEG